MESRPKFSFNFNIRDPELSIPLSVANDLVDDMYFGCNKAMMERVKKEYLEEARDCAERKLEHREDKALTIQ